MPQQIACADYGSPPFLSALAKKHDTERKDIRPKGFQNFQPSQKVKKYGDYSNPPNAF